MTDRVYRYTRDAGFQEEKYRTSTLHITWTRQQLIELLNARINLLVRDQYTKEVVTHDDLLPKHIGRRKGVDYMLDRTLMRPRDIIQFFNTCIRHADGNTTISPKALKEAEGVYSRERLRALADEWYGLYPNLPHLANLLKRRKMTFTVEEIAKSELEENYLELLISGRGENGLDMEQMKMAFESQMSLEDYRNNTLLILYKTGVIGIKTDPHSRFSWSDGGTSVSSAEVKNDSKVAVHPTFYRCFGIDTGDDDDDQQ